MKAKIIRTAKAVGANRKTLEIRKPPTSTSGKGSNLSNKQKTAAVLGTAGGAAVAVGAGALGRKSRSNYKKKYPKTFAAHRKLESGVKISKEEMYNIMKKEGSLSRFRKSAFPKDERRYMSETIKGSFRPKKRK